MPYNGNQPKASAKIAAYVLYHEFGASQRAIAGVFNSSQSTISQWIKEAEYQRKIGALEEDLAQAREMVKDLSKILCLESKIL